LDSRIETYVLAAARSPSTAPMASSSLSSSRDQSASAFSFWWSSAATKTREPARSVASCASSAGSTGGKGSEPSTPQSAGDRPFAPAQRERASAWRSVALWP
jgi:hypothetical protein